MRCKTAVFRCKSRGAVDLVDLHFCLALATLNSGAGLYCKFQENIGIVPAKPVWWHWKQQQKEKQQHSIWFSKILWLTNNTSGFKEMQLLTDQSPVYGPDCLSVGFNQTWLFKHCFPSRVISVHSNICTRRCRLNVPNLENFANPEQRYKIFKQL